MHGLLVIGFVKLAEETSVVKLTDRLVMTIAIDWDVKPQTRQTKQNWPHPLGSIVLVENLKKKKNFPLIWRFCYIFQVESLQANADIASEQLTTMKARLEKFKDVNEDENENNMKMVESDQEKSNESDSEGITLPTNVVC